MTSPTDTTRKILTVTAENEIESARTAYLKAYDAYAAQKTATNLNAMKAAYDHLQEIKKKYEEGRKLRNHSALRSQK